MKTSRWACLNRDGPMERINLDQNATTPVDPEVLEAMRPFWLSGGNPESRHSGGRAVRRAWTGAVETIAGILGAHADEVVVTSGGTEANNLAIFGILNCLERPARVISSPVEHPAVSEPVIWLEKAGFAVDRVEVEGDGVVLASKMAGLATSEARLATLMLANNETGAIQPVGEVAGLLGDRGVPVHTDAVQAVGRIPVDFHALGVSTLAASARQAARAGGSGGSAGSKGDEAGADVSRRGSAEGHQAGHARGGAGGGVRASAGGAGRVNRRRGGSVGGD